MKPALPLILIAATAACGGSSTGGSGTLPTTSGIRATDAEGWVILDEGSGASQQQSSRRTGFGDLYSYGVTASSGGGVAAYADISAPVKDLILVDPAPAAGTATFNGYYSVLGVPDVAQSLDIVEDEDDGTLTLDVDFAARTITGADDTMSFDMRIENVQDLRGTVTWRGIEGEVEGRAGEYLLLGAFHGNDDSGAFAGGIEGYE